MKFMKLFIQLPPRLVSKSNDYHNCMLIFNTIQLHHQELKDTLRMSLSNHWEHSGWHISISISIDYSDSPRFFITFKAELRIISYRLEGILTTFNHR